MWGEGQWVEVLNREWVKARRGKGDVRINGRVGSYTVRWWLEIMRCTSAFAGIGQCSPWETRELHTGRVVDVVDPDTGRCRQGNGYD